MTSLPIGVLGSATSAFVQALAARLSALGRPRGLAGAHVRLFPPAPGERVPYALLVDRASHWNPFYRSWLDAAALTGVPVINPPGARWREDKFVAAQHVMAEDIAVPALRLLPPKAYPAELPIEPEDLHNLGSPIDWEALAAGVGLPAVLKPVDGHGWEQVTLVRSAAELLAAYDQSGTRTMIVQRYVPRDRYVRVFAFGAADALVARYDPEHRRYLLDDGTISADECALVADHAGRINRALGLEFNTVEFALHDGRAWAIDFTNPVPDAEPESLGRYYFEAVVERLAHYAIARAAGG